mmetsp:Transcript_1808/g.2587  ORF Transcript_1808/g.2587 Transcript_1808/m.2587 type:complete len:225 (-) Transcript_1808:94-768(-)
MAYNGGEQNVNRLISANASFTRQRDDARRTRQLAEERLNLVKKDREVEEKKIVSMEEKLKEHLEKMQRTKAEREKLECANGEITKNYNFQHSELTSKKEKHDRADDKRKIDANERNLTMSRNREDLRKLRDASREGASQRHADNKMTVASKLRKLDEICDIDGGKEFFMKLSTDGLLSVVKDRKLKDVNEIEQGNAALRRIIAGYQNALGSSNLVDGAVSVMQQ